ncbi:hypothetical protein D3C87_190430 [compost metagenome]
MIEIIVGIWLLCFCLSMLTVGINFHLTRKKLSSKKLSTLNANLEKVELFWSSSLDDFSPLTSEALEKDTKATLRNSLLIGLLGLGSIPGFLLLLALVLSLHMLARSRKEVATFRSPLSTDTNLSKQDVETLVSQLSQIY